MCLKKWCRAITLAIVIGLLAQGGTSVYVKAAETKPKTINAETKEGRVVGAVSTTNIYREPNENSELLNSVVQNQIVRILSEEYDFYKIKYGDGYGFVQKKDFLEGEQLVAYIQSHPEWYVQSVVITAESTYLLDWLDGTAVCMALSGESYQLKEVEDKFYVAIHSLESENGATDSELVRIPKKDATLRYLLSVTNFEDYHMVDRTCTDLISFACEFVGNPYVWGGTDPLTGVDCSGFVQYVFRNFGVGLPRCSWQQAEVGNRVPLDALKPGDLIFYQRGERIGHVAIYMGNGKVVHARGRNYGICVTDYDYSVPAWAMRIM